MELALEELQTTGSCGHNVTDYDALGMHMENKSLRHINLSCHDAQDVFHYQTDLPALKYATLVFYLGTFLFGLCGNSLVIYIITTFRKIRIKSVANYYIRNLAFADLLYVLALPLFCWATYTHQWPFTGYLGEASCKIAYVCRDINKFASAFTLVALSFDRCLASYHNLGVFRTIQVGKVVCVCIWLSCVVISTPYIMYARTKTSKSGRTSCLLDWPSVNPSSGYMTFWTCFQLLLGLVIPSIVIFTTHAILCRRIKRIAGRNGKSAIKKPCRRMTQTVLAVVVTFVLCQIPYHVMQVVALDRAKTSYAYKLRGELYLPSQREFTVSICLNAVAQVLIFISSCCNPIIYGLLNENFSKHVFLYYTVVYGYIRSCLIL